MTLPIVNVPIPKQIHRRAIWAQHLRRNLLNLEKFGLAKVFEKDLPTPIIFKAPRAEQTMLCTVNDKFVWIDPWDFHSPGYFWLEGNGVPVDIDVKCILKIQYSSNDFKNTRNIPILPWTMFHFDHCNWQENQPKYKKTYESTKKEHKIGFSGRYWGFRRPWFRKLEEIKAYCNVYSRHPTTDAADYVERMSKWGIGLCLRGKRDRLTDGKNRREVEYASMGIPMILNYEPTYLNPLEHNKHFLYVDHPDKLDAAIERLEKPEERKKISEGAFEWWKNNASVEGVCKTFIQAMKKVDIL